MNGELRLGIAEIFPSLQGEGPHAGLPTVFIRTAGCNLRCRYCDTTYAQETDTNTEFLTPEEILSRMGRSATKRACITGGEPLLQREAVLSLFGTLDSRGYGVSVETNGSWPVAGLPDGLQAVIDVKTPGSGMSGVNNYENLRSARRRFDVFKFVIAEENDFEWTAGIIRKHRLDRRYGCYLSPAAGLIDPSWLAGKILKSGLDVRLNLQLHRIIWPEEERGR